MGWGLYRGGMEWDGRWRGNRVTRPHGGATGVTMCGPGAAIDSSSICSGGNWSQSWGKAVCTHYQFASVSGVNERAQQSGSDITWYCLLQRRGLVMIGHGRCSC